MRVLFVGGKMLSIVLHLVLQQCCNLLAKITKTDIFELGTSVGLNEVSEWEVAYEMA